MGLMSLSPQDLPAACLPKTLCRRLVRFQLILFILTAFFPWTHSNSPLSFTIPWPDQILNAYPIPQILRDALDQLMSLAILFLWVDTLGKGSERSKHISSQRTCERNIHLKGV